MFSKHYQDELAYLHELGKEFARAYPTLAPMLAARGGDPDVERLLEGFAFLTARVREKLDDEFPEIIHALAEMLFPQMLRPLPSAAVVEFTPRPGALRQPLRLERGTEVASIPVDGTTCRFQTTTPVTLMPLVIDGVRLENVSAGRPQLRIDLRTTTQAPLVQVLPDVLRLHFSGDLSLPLLFWTTTFAESITLVDPARTGGRGGEIELGRGALRAVGFDDHEALLPLPASVMPGLRLLLEYYTMPAKFAFVDIRGVRRVAELGSELGGKFSLVLRGRTPLELPVPLTSEAVKVNCVPVINVFPTTAEPIRVQATRAEHLVRPAGLSPAHGDVYAVRRVEMLERGTNQRTLVPPLYELGADGSTSRAPVFYTLHRRSSVVGAGTDLSLALGAPVGSGPPPTGEVLSVELLATNRQLASTLRPGDISVPTSQSPTVASFRNLAAVTPYVPPAVGRDLLWRVLAHAALNLRSLLEPASLRALLDVYHLPGLVDRQAARANQLRLGALQTIETTPIETIHRGAPVRGVSVHLKVEDAGFAGPGDMHLFGAVLDQLFASYVSINSFSRFRLSASPSNLHLAWPARSGSITLV